MSVQLAEKQEVLEKFRKIHEKITSNVRVPISLEKTNDNYLKHYNEFSTIHHEAIAISENSNIPLDKKMKLKTLSGRMGGTSIIKKTTKGGIPIMGTYIQVLAMCEVLEKDILDAVGWLEENAMKKVQLFVSNECMPMTVTTSAQAMLSPNLRASIVRINKPYVPELNNNVNYLASRNSSKLNELIFVSLGYKPEGILESLNPPILKKDVYEFLQKEGSDVNCLFQLATDTIFTTKKLAGIDDGLQYTRQNIALKPILHKEWFPWLFTKEELLNNAGYIIPEWVKEHAKKYLKHLATTNIKSDYTDCFKNHLTTLSDNDTRTPANIDRGYKLWSEFRPKVFNALGIEPHKDIITLPWKKNCVEAYFKKNFYYKGLDKKKSNVSYKSLIWRIAGIKCKNGKGGELVNLDTLFKSLDSTN